MKKITFSLILILALSHLTYAGGDIVSTVEPVVETPVIEDNGWDFRLSPYIWFAGFKGDVAGIPGFPVTVIDISSSDALEDTETSLMTMFEAKKNGQGLFMDFLYSDIKSSEVLPGIIILNSRTKTTIFSGTYLYEIYNKEQYVVDVFAGARYWKIDSHLALIGPGVSHVESWVDPVVGIKGRIVFDDTRFYFTGGATIGGFGVNSDHFYDLNANFGYQWSESIGTSIGYRLYDLDYKNDGFAYDVRQEGLIVGLNWAF